VSNLKSTLEQDNPQHKIKDHMKTSHKHSQKQNKFITQKQTIGLWKCYFQKVLL